jgi:hypothetical protein
MAERPNLDPVDEQAIAATTPSRTHGEQREERCRRAVHDVVATPVRQQMTEDASTEPERRSDPPPSTDIELETWPDGDHFHARDRRIGTRVPLAKREVRNLVALLGQPLGERPIPALGATNRTDTGSRR